MKSCSERTEIQTVVFANSEGCGKTVFRCEILSHLVLNEKMNNNLSKLIIL